MTNQPGGSRPRAVVEPSLDVSAEEYLLQQRPEHQRQRDTDRHDEKRRQKSPPGHPHRQIHRQQLPQIGGQQQRERHGEKRRQNRRHHRLGDRRNHQPSQESQHDARQAGHHLDRRLDPGPDLGAEEFAGVDRSQQSQRRAEEHRVECRFQRAEDERNQAVLRLEGVAAGGSLPGIGRRRKTFVPNRPEQRGERNFGKAHVEVPNGDSVAACRQQAVAARGKGQGGDRRRVVHLRLRQQAVARDIEHSHLAVGGSHGNRPRARRRCKRRDGRTVRRGDEFVRTQPIACGRRCGRIAFWRETRFAPAPSNHRRPTSLRRACIAEQ